MLKTSTGTWKIPHVSAVTHRFLVCVWCPFYYRRVSVLPCLTTQNGVNRMLGGESIPNPEASSYKGTSTFSGINNRFESNPDPRGNWFNEPSSEWDLAPRQEVGFTVTIQSSQQRYVFMFMNMEVSAKKSPCAKRWRLVVGIKGEFRT